MECEWNVALAVDQALEQADQLTDKALNACSFQLAVSSCLQLRARTLTAWGAAAQIALRMSALGERRS